MKITEIIDTCLNGDVTNMEYLCQIIADISDDKTKKQRQINAVLTPIEAVLGNDNPEIDKSPALYCLGLMNEYRLEREDEVVIEAEAELTREEARAALLIKEEQLIKAARDRYQEAVDEHEHIPSMIRLANMIARGEGGDQNIVTAINLYKRIAAAGTKIEQDLARAQIEELTPYTPQNINKLFSAVLAGNPNAAATLTHRTQTLVGQKNISQLGRNISMKLRSAIDTSQAGVLQYSKAVLLEQSLQGEGVEDQDVISAYKTAVNLNNANAMNAMANIYLEGLYGFEVDKDAAIELLTRAADAEENPLAARQAVQGLVKLYREDQDAVMQRKYLIRLCQLGDADAMLELADLYHERLLDMEITVSDGELDKHLNKMIGLYQEAGNRGIHQAYFNLAEVYNVGLRNIQPDLGKALYYYHLAASKKNEDALSVDLDDIKATYLRLKAVRSLTQLEEMVVEADIEASLFIENRRQADKKLDALFLSIEALKKHGDTFKADSKGKMLLRLAKQLEGKLTTFILDLADEEIPANKKDVKALTLFKKEFRDIIAENSKDLQGHRAKWKPMLTNILIALTGVGLAALIGRAVIVALFSSKKNANIFNKYAFFGETTSEELSRTVESSLDAEIDVLRKTAPVAR